MLNIYQRLNAAKADVSYIQKDKEVQGYMAVTHDQVTAHTRQALMDHGIVVVPSEEASAVAATGMATKQGIPIIRFEATYGISFVNIDDPKDVCVIRITSHANDTGDKAPGKAISYAVKYAILKALQLETGEDDEGRIQPEPTSISEQQRKDHEEAIIKAKSIADLEGVWKVIAESCREANDKESYGQLKDKVLARKAELQKGAAE